MALLYCYIIVSIIEKERRFPKSFLVKIKLKSKTFTLKVVAKLTLTSSKDPNNHMLLNKNN